MVIVTTLVTPPMLRAAFSGPAPEEPRQEPLAKAAGQPARAGSVDAGGREEKVAAAPAEQAPGEAQAAESESSGSGPPGASSGDPVVGDPAVEPHEPEPDKEAQEFTGASAPAEQTGTEDESATSEREE
jgi:hypothetical protein